MIRPDRRQFLGAGAALAAFPAAAAMNTGPSLSAPLADGSTKGVYVFGVASQAYVAEEYLMSGFADIYESVTMADALDMGERDSVKDLGRRTFDHVVTTAHAPYVTRLIVYRPRDPAHFSGNVIVESIHPANGGSAAVWGPMNAVFLANGDAYCLVQHPVTFAGLKGAAGDRYGALLAAHPTQIWGMLRDAGVVLRERETGPLRGYAVRRLYMTGYSYTGVATATFANFHHHAARQADGAPLFDGYLPMANATYVRPLDVPVMRMNTQSDFDSFGGLNNRGVESDVQGSQYRLYEVAGAAHVRAPLGWASVAAAPIAKVAVPTAPGQPHMNPNACYAAFPKGSRMNDMPFALAAAQMFSNMYAWRDEGVAPPHTPVIETSAAGAARLDADGNALGGLRLPQMAVPAATYGVGLGSCMLFGYTQPFSASRIETLYGSPAQYAARLEQAGQRLIDQKIIIDNTKLKTSAA